MLLKCRTLHALKFAFVSKSEAMHHLALENMKNLKVNVLFVANKKLDLYGTDVWTVLLVLVEDTTERVTWRANN